MSLETMYHVTDASNVESILSEGIEAGQAKNRVFLMDDPEKALEYGEVLDVHDDPVVLSVDVQEHKITPDDEEPGEEFADHAFFVRGDVPAHRVETVEGVDA